MKYVKRLFIVVLALPILAFAWVQVRENSEFFAYDIVHLRCATIDTYGADHIENFEAFSKDRPIIFGRLRKDWINNHVILRIISSVGMAEDGLQAPQILTSSVRRYASVWNSEKKWQDTIDRNTLVLTREYKDDDTSYAFAWKKRQCEIIDKAVFEKRRNEVVSATKDAQKI